MTTRNLLYPFFGFKQAWEERPRHGNGDVFVVNALMSGIFAALALWGIAALGASIGLALNQKFAWAAWSFAAYAVGLGIYRSWDKATTYNTRPSEPGATMFNFGVNFDILVHCVLVVLALILYPYLGFKWAWEDRYRGKEGVGYGLIALWGTISLAGTVWAALQHSMLWVTLAFAAYTAGFTAHVLWSRNHE